MMNNNPFDNVNILPHDGRLLVAIPTVGRRDIVIKTVHQIAQQHRLPDVLYLAIAAPSDIYPVSFDALPFPVEIITAKKGACAQRNRILDEVKPQDVLVFLDDDFLMAPDYLGRVERIFNENPTISMVTGTVLADGIKGPGFDHIKGAKLLAQRFIFDAAQEFDPIYNGYGCNMAIRGAPIVSDRIRFDENLPRYGWLEDIDFSRHLAKHGSIVRAHELQGVHLGTKTGRTPGLLLGYSQIANPIYLVGKGTMKPRQAARIIGRNMLANLLKALWPEPWVDRRGRLRGNLRAFGDLTIGRCRPDRILEIQP